MSRLKLRLPSLARIRAERALFPAVGSGLLALLLLVQLLMSGPVDLPRSGVTGGGMRVRMPIIVGEAAPTLLSKDPVFTPARSTASGKMAGSVAGPLDGAFVAGYVAVRGRGFALLQRPDRSTLRLAPGGSYAGWRLAALRPDGATFVKDGKAIHLAYGSAAPAAAASSAESDSEEESE